MPQGHTAGPLPATVAALPAEVGPLTSEVPTESTKSDGTDPLGRYSVVAVQSESTNGRVAFWGITRYVRP